MSRVLSHGGDRRIGTALLDAMVEIAADFLNCSRVAMVCCHALVIDSISVRICSVLFDSVRFWLRQAACKPGSVRGAPN